MAKLNEMGEFVRSASSTIEAPVVRRLKEAFGRCRRQVRRQEVPGCQSRVPEGRFRSRPHPSLNSNQKRRRRRPRPRRPYPRPPRPSRRLRRWPRRGPRFRRCRGPQARPASARSASPVPPPPSRRRLRRPSRPTLPGPAPSRVRRASPRLPARSPVRVPSVPLPVAPSAPRRRASVPVAVRVRATTRSPRPTPAWAPPSRGRVPALVRGVTVRRVRAATVPVVRLAATVRPARRRVRHPAEAVPAPPAPVVLVRTRVACRPGREARVRAR